MKKNINGKTDSWKKRTNLSKNLDSRCTFDFIVTTISKKEKIDKRKGSQII